MRPLLRRSEGSSILEALALQQAVAMAQDLWQRMQVHPGAWQ